MTFFIFRIRKLLIPTVNSEKVEPVHILIKNEVYNVKSLKISLFSNLVLLVYIAIIINVMNISFSLAILGIMLAIYFCFENFWILLEIPELFGSFSITKQHTKNI